MNVYQRNVLTTAVAASFASFFSGTVVIVALPKIAEDLGGGLAGQQWVMNVYLVAFGALILLAGSLSDRFGRGRILNVGLVGFGAASMAVAAAPSLEFLIAARGLQGVAGALLVPSSLALITSAFTGGAQSRAIGIWTSATSGASIAAPLIGGLLADYVSWRWAFAVVTVPVVLALLLSRTIEGDRGSRSAERIDFVGAALCVTSLGGTIFALIEGSSREWSNPVVVAALVLGIGSFTGFIARQRFGADPMLPLWLFRQRNFGAGNLATAFIYAAISLNGFTMGVYLQQGAGVSATLAGFASVPVTIIMISGSSWVARAAGRVGPRAFMVAGPAIMALGSVLLLNVSEDFNYWSQVLPGISLFGIGLTITVAPLTSAILGAVEPSRSGIASAVNNAVARVAGLVVVALVGVIAGTDLDLDGFHRTSIMVALLLALGSATAYVGIRNAELRPLNGSDQPRISPAPCTGADVPVATRP